MCIAHYPHASTRHIYCAKLHCMYTHVLQGKNTQGLHMILPPEMKKRALENQKRAPENRHRLQCKSLFNIADLDNGM